MAALLTMRGIVKQFPGVRALDGVDLDVEPGEVHCLLGQNGAGKSTLIKVLAGAHRPDAGEITFDGRPVSFTSPQAADQAGIATIYQELDLVPAAGMARTTVSAAVDELLQRGVVRIAGTRPTPGRGPAWSAPRCWPARSPTDSRHDPDP